MAAAETAPLDLINCLDGYVECGRRLMQDFGLEIQYASLGPDIGEYNGTDRKVIINGSAPIKDQLWFLIQVWQLCAIGPEAVPDAIPENRNLRLVET